MAMTENRAAAYRSPPVKMCITTVVAVSWWLRVWMWLLRRTSLAWRVTVRDGFVFFSTAMRDHGGFVVDCLPAALDSIERVTLGSEWILPGGASTVPAHWVPHVRKRMQSLQQACLLMVPKSELDKTASKPKERPYDD